MTIALSLINSILRQAQYELDNNIDFQAHVAQARLVLSAIEGSTTFGLKALGKGWD